VSFSLYFDEHVHADLAEMLIKDGFDVLTALAAGRANQGISDPDQLAYATRLGRVFVTFNARDFYPIAIQWQSEGRPYSGIIVSHQRPAWELYPLFLAILADYPDGFPEGLCRRL
jgi:hypothetical protein